MSDIVERLRSAIETVYLERITHSELSDEAADEIERLRGELAIIEKPTGILELERQLEDATSELDDAQTRIAALEKVVEAAQTAQDMADDPNVPDDDLVAAALVLRERLGEVSDE